MTKRRKILEMGFGELFMVRELKKACKALVAQASAYEKAKQNEIFWVCVCLRDNRSGERIRVDVAR